MMTNKKKILAVIIVAIIGSIIFWKRSWIKQKMGLNKGFETGEENQNKLPVPSPTGSSGINYKTCSSYPVKFGCKGEKVKQVQRLLNKAHKSGLNVDGYFGAKTRSALVSNGYGEIATVSVVAKLTSKFFSA